MPSLFHSLEHCHPGLYHGRIVPIQNDVRINIITDEHTVLASRITMLLMVLSGNLYRCRICAVGKYNKLRQRSTLLLNISTNTAIGISTFSKSSKRQNSKHYDWIPRHSLRWQCIYFLSNRSKRLYNRNLCLTNHLNWLAVFHLLCLLLCDDINPVSLQLV